ncbi:MAG: hypothetical protein R3F11_10315 [Verrucomicrobiales bacterium]
MRETDGTAGTVEPGGEDHAQEDHQSGADVRLRAHILDVAGRSQSTAQPQKFDLVQCDWLPPFGKRLPDLVFTVEEAIRIDDWRGSTKLRLGFTNPRDGIIDLDVGRSGKKEQPAAPQKKPADGYKERNSDRFGYPLRAGIPEIRVSQMDGDEDWG